MSQEIATHRHHQTVQEPMRPKPGSVSEEVENCLEEELKDLDEILAMLGVQTAGLESKATETSTKPRSPSPPLPPPPVELQSDPVQFVTPPPSTESAPQSISTYTWTPSKTATSSASTASTPPPTASKPAPTTITPQHTASIPASTTTAPPPTAPKPASKATTPADTTTSTPVANMDRSQELEALLQGLQLGISKHVDNSKSTQQSDSSKMEQTVTGQQEAKVDVDRKPALPSNSQTTVSPALNATSSTTKGMCGACNMPVIGQSITALGKVWHVDHFKCAHCETPFGPRSFYERNGLAYCESDYQSLFAAKCGSCAEPIIGKYITAMEKSWHPEHFTCAQCDKPFGEDGFHEHEGKPYCRTDYAEKFAPKCGGCKWPILGTFTTAFNQQWHIDCFVCADCKVPFGSANYYEKDGLPYCEKHYHIQIGWLCEVCEEAIIGQCVRAMNKKFHPIHFQCTFCRKQLTKETFKENQNKPYCHVCFEKLF